MTALHAPVATVSSRQTHGDSYVMFAALFNDNQVIDMRSIFSDLFYDSQQQSVVADCISAMFLELKKLVAVL